MARRAGITQQWLRDQAEAGEIPSLKAGHRYLFNSQVVLQTLVAKAGGNGKGGEK